MIYELEVLKTCDFSNVDVSRYIDSHE